MGLRGYPPHRREQAVADIEALIRRQGLWGRRLPAEREMAQALGISRGTLQRALELLESRGVVCRRHGSGTFAAERAGSGRAAPDAQGRLAVIVSRKSLPVDRWNYYGDMVRGALRAARRRGVPADVVVLEEVWVPGSGPGPGWARLRDFAGYLVVERNDPAIIRHLLKFRLGPVVLLDATFRDLPVIGVVDGSFEGARRAVHYLVHLGHRRIAYIGPGKEAAGPHEKTEGCLAAFAEAGLRSEPGLAVSPEHERVEAEVDAAVERWLARPEAPTAVFAATDHRALAAVAALEQRGRRVGQDFAVVGFGDQAFRLGHSSRLTSVRIHTRQMGQAALAAALEAGRRSEGRTIIVPDRLIVRQSSCRCREAQVAGDRAGKRCQEPFVQSTRRAVPAKGS